MNRGRLIIVFLGFVSTSLAASEPSISDVVAALRERDKSISTYVITLRRGWMVGPSDPEKVVADFAGKDRSVRPEELFVQIVARLAGGQPVAWTKFSSVQRGELFKTVVTLPAGGDILHFYDGERYVKLQPKLQTPQVDIYSPGYNEGRFSMAQLGLVLGKVLDAANVLAHERRGDSLTITLKASDSFSVAVELDSDLVAKGRRGIRNGKVVSQQWYLCPRRFGAYTFPQVIVISNPSDPSGGTDAVIIEDIQLNVPVADEQLRMGEIPDRAVVVDHRQNPPKVEQFRKLSAEWQRHYERSPGPAGVRPPSAPPEAPLGAAPAPQLRTWLVPVLWAGSALALLAVLVYAFKRSQGQR